MEIIHLNNSFCTNKKSKRADKFHPLFECNNVNRFIADRTGQLRPNKRVKKQA